MRFLTRGSQMIFYENKSVISGIVILDPELLGFGRREQP